MNPGDALTDEIDRMLADLAGGSASNSRNVGIRLVDLIERQDRTHAAELHLLETTASALQEATARLRHVTTVGDVVRTACPGAAAIAECDDVVFSELDGVHASPLGATGAFPGLPAPFRLPSGVVDPANPCIPELFTHGRYAVFRVDVGGRPAAVIHVGTTPPVPVADALASFASLVGTALECAALKRRGHRQRDLLHAVWGQGDAASESNGTLPAATGIPSAQQLTAREREILALVLTGSSNGAIARELVISVETVRTHVKRVLRKCGVANRAELIARFEPDRQA